MYVREGLLDDLAQERVEPLDEFGSEARRVRIAPGSCRLYFLATGFHFVHVLVGLTMLTYVAVRIGRKPFEDDETALTPSPIQADATSRPVSCSASTSSAVHDRVHRR